MEWNYSSIPIHQCCGHWSLEMDKYFHPTLYWACENDPSYEQECHILLFVLINCFCLPVCIGILFFRFLSESCLLKLSMDLRILSGLELVSLRDWNACHWNLWTVCNISSYNWIFVLCKFLWLIPVINFKQCFMGWFWIIDHVNLNQMWS